jgi:hypothetical protein
LYVRQQFSQCLKVIEEQLQVRQRPAVMLQPLDLATVADASPWGQACRGTCEYPIYVKALILRQQGKIQESLTLFQVWLMLAYRQVVWHAGQW